MRHQKSGRRFNRDTDARKALMRNLCTSLLESPSGRITTTEARAKELRRWVERLITTAKDGDVNARRRVSAEISKPEVVERLFSNLMPRLSERPGGYTRIIHKPPRLGDSGRTAAGAHAERQGASFQTDGRITPHRLMAALNARLPEDVAVLTAEEVPDDFHARYSARWRRYRYRYLDRTARPALQRGRCWHVRGPLDVAAMAKAARALVGRHDWTSYCSASEPARDRVRTMRSDAVARRGEFVELELVAEGF